MGTLLLRTHTHIIIRTHRLGITTTVRFLRHALYYCTVPFSVLCTVSWTSRGQPAKMAAVVGLSLYPSLRLLYTIWYTCSDPRGLEIMNEWMMESWLPRGLQLCWLPYFWPLCLLCPLPVPFDFCLWLPSIPSLSTPPWALYGSRLPAPYSGNQYSFVPPPQPHQG